MGLLNETQQSYYNGTNHGDYQFTSLTDIINQFMVVYVGEDKIIRNANRTDVAFHAQRALAELSFDTLKSCKAQEITVPPSLQMILPQDYVNYTKISWVDSAGIKHLIYPTSKTSNPSDNPLQDSNGDFKLQATGSILINTPTITITTPEQRILVGMVVEGPLIPAGTQVIKIVHSLTNSIITLGIDDGTIYPYAWPQIVYPQSIGAGVFTFYNKDGTLVLPQKFNFNVTGSILAASFDFVAASASDAANIKPGMIANFSIFPLGTVVEAVSGLIITVSNLPFLAGDFFGNFVSHEGYLSEIGEYKDSDTWANYKSQTPSENQDDYQDDTYWPMEGSRYGLDPQHAQANGSFYIDCVSGKIHFSSNISGKTVILDYISDSLGTDGEMQVHKFAEEAMYKWMSHAILSGKANIPEYQVNRLKKERFAAIRTAKLRLSNLKLEELTQILRGKSKQIKH